jgi:hypothetical protein
MLVSTIGGPSRADGQRANCAVAQGFVIADSDLRFIFHQIEIAENHAGGGQLLGPGPNQVNLFGTPNPQLPLGLRTVDGSFNNLVPVPDQHLFGAADLPFPRLTTPNFRSAETLPFDPDGPGPQAAGQPTSTPEDRLRQRPQPRVISNLHRHQTPTNPAAVAAANRAARAASCAGDRRSPIRSRAASSRTRPTSACRAQPDVHLRPVRPRPDLVTKGGGSVAPRSPTIRCSSRAARPISWS